MVSVNDFWFRRRLPRTFASSSAFPEMFVFYIGMIVSTVLPSLVPRQRIDDCFEIHILY